MDTLTILAHAAQTAVSDPNAVNPIVQGAWAQVTRLDLVEAITFISFGAVCLVYGYRIYKILVTICFGLAGLLLGVLANKTLIEGNVVWLCLIIVALFVGLSYPFVKWGVCILGGLAGAMLAAGVWLAFGMPPQFMWAGALTGLVAGGMISFAAFKVAVLLFTCLQGSVLLAMGGLGIFYTYLYVPGREKLQGLVFEQRWFLPLVLVAPLLIGIAIQYKLSKGEDLSPGGGGS
jgi:hypothetical protein